MTTSIKRTLTIATMGKVFDAPSSLISIRFFQALNHDSTKKYPKTEKFVFEIVIRHNEHTSAGTLFDEAIKNLGNVK